MSITSSLLKKSAGRLLLSGKITAGICLLSSSVAYAADNWEFQPSIKEAMSWESNPQMLSGSHQSLFGSVTTPQLTITDNTPTTKLNAQATINEGVFNHSNFNSTDLHSNINLGKKMERWEAGIGEQTDYDTTRTSELTTLNVNTTGSVRHLSNTVSPTISFSPSILDKISLGGSYLESRYDSSLFVNYHIISLNPSYQYNITPVDTVTLLTQVQRYQTDTSVSTNTDSFAPSLGWTRTITPSLTAKANVGVEAFRQGGDNIPTTAWSKKPIYSANLSYKEDTDTLSLDLSRALQPYVNGTELFLNSISLSDTHNFNTLFSSNLSASYQFSNNSAQGASSLKSLISTTAGVTYHATGTIDIATSYQYREQTLNNISGNQNDHIILFSLAYHPQTRW
jgi:hypothetical protein